MNAHIPLALVHGWGFRATVWDHLTPRLAADTRGLSIPGYADGAPQRLYLDNVTAALLARLPQAIDVMGWSLGGLIALSCALQQPQRIRRLVVLAATPSFVRRPHWPFGIDPERLYAVQAGVMRHPRTALNRFAALTVHGVANADALLKRVRPHLCTDAPSGVLLDTLQILIDADLTDKIRRIRCPVLWIFGGLDRVVGARQAQVLVRRMPNARIEILPDAGHLPFFSHSDICVSLVREFLS